MYSPDYVEVIRNNQYIIRALNLIEYCNDEASITIDQDDSLKKCAEFMVGSRFRIKKSDPLYNDMVFLISQKSVGSKMWLGIAFNNPPNQTESVSMIHDLYNKIRSKGGKYIISWVTDIDQSHRQDMLSIYESAGFDTSVRYTNINGSKCCIIFKNLG